MSKDLKSSRRGGFYWKENIPFVSVTNVIGIIDKPQLLYWFGKQVYLAMVKNPNLDEKEALSAPRNVTEKAADRGTTVHSICESFKNNGKMPDYIPDNFLGYARAFEEWIKTHNIHIIEHERSIFSHLHQYAGTVDFIYRIGNDPRVFVGDIKTGKDLYDTVWLQTSAYANALREEGLEISGVSALLLREDGTFKFETGQECFDHFLHAKALWEWKHREDLLKLGYHPTMKISFGDV